MGWEAWGGEGREGLAALEELGRPGCQASQQAPRGEVVQRPGEQAGRGEGGPAFNPHGHFKATKNVLLGLACKFYQASSAAGQRAGQGTLSIRNCQG